MQNDDHAPAEGHDPKEEVKEHATDKFTEKKVEREIPDEPAQETIRKTEVVREQESIATDLEVEGGEST